MIVLDKEKIIQLHSKLIKKTGGIDGIRDMTMLEISIHSIYASFGDYERYPTVEEKSARLCYSLISNHPFLDGNKRIGVLIMLMTLKLNNKSLEYTQDELIQLGLNVASSKQYDYDYVYCWIKEHLIENKMKV